jgi:predicted MFS family arabinose efflux permease
MRLQMPYYGWFVAAVTMIVIMITAGQRAAPGAWLVTMRADLGWSTASLSLAASLGILIYGLSGPLAAAAVARFGVRATVTVSLVASAVTLALTSLVRTEWQLLLAFGVGSGIATGLVGGVLGAVVANRWFVRHRGLVVGMMSAAVSVGQLVFFPVLTLAAVTMGWREAALLLAAICLVIVPAVILVLRDGPERLGLTPLGGTAPPPVAPGGPGVMRRAVVSPTFWLLCATFFVCGATSTGLINQHFIPHAMGHGFSAGVAASALAVIGAFNFVGTIASGWLTDRFDPRRLLLMYYVLRGVSLLALPLVGDGVGLFAFSILFGLDYIATVPPTVAIAADTFGRRHVGVVYGWIFAAHQVGAAAAAWGAGLAHDAVGNYVASFLFAGVLAILAGGMALLIRRAPPESAAPALSPAA